MREIKIFTAFEAEFVSNLKKKMITNPLILEYSTSHLLTEAKFKGCEGQGQCH